MKLGVSLPSPTLYDSRPLPSFLLGGLGSRTFHESQEFFFKACFPVRSPDTVVAGRISTRWPLNTYA